MKRVCLSPFQWLTFKCITRLPRVLWECQSFVLSRKQATWENYHVNICSLRLEFKADQFVLKGSQEYGHSLNNRWHPKISFSFTSLTMMHILIFFTEDETPTKSTVLGRPVLLALEDVDGAPSFLEKALRFVEDHGISFRPFSLTCWLLLVTLFWNKTTISCRSQDRRNLETSCRCWWCWTPDSRIWARFEFYVYVHDYVYLFFISWFPALCKVLICRHLVQGKMSSVPRRMLILLLIALRYLLLFTTMLS